MLIDKEPFDPSAQSIKIQTLPVDSNGLREKAILFLHGFPSSPATYVYTAKQASQRGYDVFAPRIPTFASDYNLFAQSSFPQWYQFIKEFYQTHRIEYKYFYIVGTSMGGAMALKLAEDFSQTELAPTAISTIATPVFINKWIRGHIKQPIAPLLPLFALFIKKIRPANKYPSSKELDGIENWVGYKGFFPRQILSLFQNLRKIDRQLPKITVPIRLFHGKTDKTVPHINMKYISKKISSSAIESETLNIKHLKSRHHCLLLYTSLRDDIFEKIDTFFTQQKNKGDSI